jgi:uncharacterized membrane protein YeaQ/YmgE (transglycosylase-associated protein family)
MFTLFLVGMSFAREYESVQAGDTILADIIGRPGVALFMLAGFGSGIAAFLTGLLAIIRNKERAFLVFISTIIGALLILFLAGEIASPH